MADELKNAVLAVQATLRTVTGIRGAPDYPPEQIPAEYFPFAVAYPGSGVSTFHVPGERLFLGEIVVELHVSRKDLPNAARSAMGFADSIPNALMVDPTIDGKVETFGGIDQSFGELGWGDLPTLGFRFILRGVKIRVTL